MTLAPKPTALPGVVIDIAVQGTAGEFAAVMDTAAMALPSTAGTGPEIAGQSDDAGAESESLKETPILEERIVVESAPDSCQHPMSIPEAAPVFQPPKLPDRPADQAAAFMPSQQNGPAAGGTGDAPADMRAIRAEHGSEAPDRPAQRDADTSPMTADPHMIRSARTARPERMRRPVQDEPLALPCSQLTALPLGVQAPDATGTDGTSATSRQGIQVNSTVAQQPEPSPPKHFASAGEPRSAAASDGPEISRGSDRHPAEDTRIAIPLTTNQPASYRAVLTPSHGQGSETPAPMPMPMPMPMPNEERGTVHPRPPILPEQASAPSSTVRSSVPTAHPPPPETPGQVMRTSPLPHVEPQRSAPVAPRGDAARFDQTPVNIPTRTDPGTGPKAQGFEPDRAAMTGSMTSLINPGNQGKTSPADNTAALLTEQDGQQTVVSAFDLGPRGEPSAASIRHSPPAAAEPLRSIPPHLLEPHRQIADAIVRSRDGTVEILLDPVELGRVTVLLGSDTHPGRLGILVERPETLDMIRRHTDELVRDLRDNGMPDARMDFLRQDSSGGQNRGRQTPGPAEANAPKQGADTSVPPTGPDRRAPLLASGARLDIRL